MRPILAQPRCPPVSPTHTGKGQHVQQGAKVDPLVRELCRMVEDADAWDEVVGVAALIRDWRMQNVEREGMKTVRKWLYQSDPQRTLPAEMVLPIVAICARLGVQESISSMVQLTVLQAKIEPEKPEKPGVRAVRRERVGRAVA